MCQVREIILFGWPLVRKHQQRHPRSSAGHCHFEICKNLAGCVNNILDHFDMADAENHDCTDGLCAILDCTDGLGATLELEADKNDGIPCEFGISYHTLQSTLTLQC
jgi:hypothetical protein